MYRLRYAVALLMSMLLLLPACTLSQNTSEGEGNMVYTDEDSVARSRFEQILEAIENRDNAMLKSLYSEKALSESENIDESIDRLFELIKGSVESWELEGWSSGESIRSGEKNRQIRAWFILTTTEGTYKLFMLDYDSDTIEPSNQGLYALRAIDAEDEDEYFTSWQKMKIPGVFVPEEYCQS